MNHIEVSDLSYRPSGVKHPILTDISYTFAQGHMTALLGPNGSGKTTLLRHFLAQIKSGQGVVRIDGKSISEYSPRDLGKQVAWVPQSHNGESPFAVEDVVRMARYPYKKTFDADTEEDDRIVKEAMENVEILDLKDRDFSSLSGGERQRALIARALTQATPWILLDEPTSNLDVKHQLGILSMLRKKVDAGALSVIVVMHDFNLVERFCDHAVLLSHGKVVEKGSTQEVLRPELLKEVYEVDFEVIEKNGQRLFFPKDPA